MRSLAHAAGFQNAKTMCVFQGATECHVALWTAFDGFDKFGAFDNLRKSKLTAGELRKLRAMDWNCPEWGKKGYDAPVRSGKAATKTSSVSSVPWKNPRGFARISTRGPALF
jgi:hypothetical protein